MSRHSISVSHLFFLFLFISVWKIYFCSEIGTTRTMIKLYVTCFLCHGQRLVTIFVFKDWPRSNFNFITTIFLFFFISGKKHQILLIKDASKYRKYIYIISVIRQIVRTKDEKWIKNKSDQITQNHKSLWTIKRILL